MRHDVRDTELTVPDHKGKREDSLHKHAHQWHRITKKDKPSSKDGVCTVRKVSPEEMERLWKGGK